MGKPSIFSRDYNNRMKKRKQRIAGFIIILMILVGIFLYSNNIKLFLGNKIAALKNIKINILYKNANKNEIKPNDNKKAEIDTKTDPVTSANKIEEKGIDVALSDGTKIKAVYENKDGSDKFKYVSPIDAPISFSVNPSGTSMVILENNTQDMFNVSIDGTVLKVNDTQYESSSEGIFYKEGILQSKTGYIWCSSPKFIDDNNVVYISQVPYFNRTTKYIWAFNIKDTNIKNRNNHTLCKLSGEDVGGNNVKFGNLTDKGLEVIIDNNTKYIKNNGQSTEITN